MAPPIVADEAVAAALTATKTVALAERPMDELSGAQRQRIWIAIALAWQQNKAGIKESGAISGRQQPRLARG
ncbi:energy-coupling factor transporter ATP-binding protein EcfA2 [Phyllobacterium myrsinacearum]|uniref:Energy-coupling factor transporter ATP-binding protein EcfA2 n=1 Tax=Phyllobacterium myrsinacearum TaxID=28101 RepID=A0A839EXE4_9HYPH|nr:energy-coupling factor transporter ATP-binding protein EcfA2 [Phyllobacterium myrsinacearum]